MGSPEGTFDTKLHEAVRNGVIGEVKEALRQGYDPNLIGMFQWSPMHEAADNGDSDILKLLILKKGDPNKPDYMQGRTPMHYATERGHIECLKLLIDSGGRYDFKDEMGKDCLDLCTPASRKMLERLKVRDLMLRPDSDTTQEDKTSLPDQASSDQHSIKSGLDSNATSRKSSISSIQEKQPVIGYLHLSVEYHSSKQTLKVRIWQLSDLLLPPPHTSGIHSIYVKSLLLPDKKKDTKRKTEDIRVDTSEAHVQWKNKSSGHYAFIPSTFKFKRALDYSKINMDIVKERTLQIEVSVTQRYSHRSYLIGMLSIPLRKAVKKVVREKIALIPCMNHTIPSNMKVYSASELEITSNKVFYSTPNVKINVQESFDDTSEKAASNPDLQPNKYSPSVEVDMYNIARGIPKVPKLNLEDTPLDESGYSSEFHMSLPGDLDSPDSDKVIVKSSNVNQTKSSVVSIHEDSSGNVNKVLDGVKDKSAGSSTVSKVLEKVKDKLSSQKTRAVTKVSNGIEITDLDEEEPVSISVTTDTKTKTDTSVVIKSDGQESSRPETPTWDYYDVPTDVAVDNQLPPSPWSEGAVPVILPMETNLSIHQSKDSINTGTDGQTTATMTITKSPTKVRKKSKRHQTPPIPGRAIPLVPEIIIVNTDETGHIDKTRQYSETKITMADHDLDSVPDRIQVDKASANVDHVVKIKSIKPVKRDKERSATNSWLMEKSNVKNSGEEISARAICVIEPSDSVESVSMDTYNASLPVARPRTKKLRKVKEGGTKSRLDSQKGKLELVSSDSPVLVAETLKSRKTGITHSTPPERNTRPNRDEHMSELNRTTGSGHGGLPHVNKTRQFRDESELSDIKVINTGISKSRDSTSSASFIVDMESFGNSGSHIVELDDDISITELSDNSDLFTHSSVISSTSVDMESGLESYKLPERVSPTKYMIPMQVYMDDDTSCDESLPTDRSERSHKIYGAQKSSSEI